MSEDVQKMESELAAAAKRLTMFAGISSQLNRRVSAEQEYYIAYRDLVRLGLRPKLRAKYRVG